MNTGDIAWILLASALVLLMTPGLALFYGGLSRSKNAAGTIMHSFMCMGIVGVVWVLWGYSLAFGPDVGSFIGDFSFLGLSGVSASLPGPYADNMPHQTFMIFQGMFAIITPALVTGAFAERMKFSTFVIFIVLWVTIVYAPVAHWVWGGGWLGELGALDFAGGSVVHINSGLPHWPPRLSSASGSDSGPRQWSRTTSRWWSSAQGCCGSAGSDSTQAPRSGGRRHRGQRIRRYQHRGGGGTSRLDRHVVDTRWQTVGHRRGIGRNRRSRRYHAGRGLRRADAIHRNRTRRRESSAIWQSDSSSG